MISLCCCCCFDFILGAKSYSYLNDDNIAFPHVHISLFSPKHGLSTSRAKTFLDGSFNYNFVGTDMYGRPFTVDPNSNFSYVPDLKYDTSCNLYVKLTSDKTFEEHFSDLVSKILSFEQVLATRMYYSDFLELGLEATCRSGTIYQYGHLEITNVRIASRIAVFPNDGLDEIMFDLSKVYEYYLKDLYA